MKMKMFIHNSPEGAQDEVNKWLGENEVDLCHVVQSQCERQGRFVLILSVFYELKHIDAKREPSALREHECLTGVFNGW